MRGTLTKLLTATTLGLILYSPRVPGQCALITDNYSGQVPSSVCAPVNLTMDVRYKFILPVDPAKVQILYVWNDGTGSTTLIPAISQGDTVFTAQATHLYPPADACSYTAEAYVVYDGQQCVSSSRQEQTFSAWARDNENGADIITDPVVAQFCEGEDIVDVTFRDNSTFNCNIHVEPDKPNRITRWVQFIYGTKSIGGPRIPDVTIRDPLGNVYQMTDSLGNSLPPVSGPIIAIPIPADGPSQISWPISAPAGAVAGDIFEITMRNWNICNPYDHNPFDAYPPTDTVNGDFPPITTTALIEIITTPPKITNPSLEFCAGSPINLTLSTSGGQVDWYTDSLLTHHIHNGNSFDPTGPPTYVDNTKAGTYSYYVTEHIGACGSAPSKVSFTIFDTPAPAPDAGRDTVVCSDTYRMNGNTPVIGHGLWTTTSTATIDDPADPNTQVHHLSPGPNLFRWTITNGPCVSVDEVILTRDQQPDAASAGFDQSFCNDSTAVLHANSPTNQGQGTWSFASGSAVFSDVHDPGTSVSSLEGGTNVLVWTIASRYGACITTHDTLRILRDLLPGMAYAGPDRGICDSSAIRLAALPALNEGTGTWSVVSGGATFTDPHNPSDLVTGLPFGSNRLRWSIVSRLGICPASSDDVILTRDQSPDPAFAGLDQNLCNSVSAPLGANPPSLGTATWEVVENPSGVDPVFNPSITSPVATVQILPGNEGVYRFAWTITHASCRTSDTMQIDFGTPVPTANAGPADSVCGLSAILSGSSPGKGTGTWSRLSGSGSVNFVPDSHSPACEAVIPAGQEGLYTFEWRITSGSCPPSADTTEIWFKPMPGIPVVQNVSRCGPGTVTLTASPGLNGDGVNWYLAATGGTPAGTGNSFVTPVISSATDYWAASYNMATGCESFRVRVHIAIHPVPSVPAVHDIQHCGSTGLVLNGTPGAGANTNRWYDSLSGGNLLTQSPTYTTPMLDSSLTYWVSSFNDTTGCESSRVPLTVTIFPVPDSPVTTDTGRCGAGALTLHTTLGANGTGIQWYDAASGGNLIGSSLFYTTPYLTHSQQYWVQTVNSVTGCTSGRMTVTAAIHPVPGYPNVGDLTHCGPDSLVLVSAPGADGVVDRWYDSLIGGALLFEGNNYQTPYVTTTTHYYVSSYDPATLCESSRRQMTAAILPVPGPNPILGPSLVGLTQTNVIYSVNYQPGSTYAWSIPPGMDVLLTNANFVIVGFPNLGTYNLSMVETNSVGCPGPVEPKEVLVKDVLILLNMNVTHGETCVGEDLQLAVSPTGGTPSYTFAWGGATQYLSSTGTSNPVFNSPVPGTYSLQVTVTDINGNHSSDTVQVTVHPNPVVRIEVPDTLVCAGSNLDLSTQVTGGSGNIVDYTWSGETLHLSSTDIPNPVFSSLIRGTYPVRVTVEDDKGCHASDSLRIFNDSPLANFTSNAVPGCSPVQVAFTNHSENAATYYWDFGDNTVSHAENPVHQFVNGTASVTYFNVKLTAISENNCLHTTNNYVTVYPNSSLNITSYPETACSPADILLSSTPGGYTYHWDFGDGEATAGEFNIMHTFVNQTNRDTTFTVQLISTTYFSCLDTGYAQITVHPSPQASFTADPESQMIPDRTVSLTNTTPPGDWSYFWVFGDDSTSDQREPEPHVYPGPANYLIKLVVKGRYCADSTWQSVQIVPHPPVAEFMAIDPGCAPLTIQFKNTSTYSNSFLWEFGDGAVSNKPNPKYTYYQPGTYKIKLTAWGDGGSDSYSTEDDVWVLPKAYFEIAPRIVYVNKQTVYFFNKSDNGDIYLWDFGDGTESSEMNPTHVYTKDGNFTVTLQVWTKNNCYDLFEMETAVVVEPTGTIIFPNAFRPESLIEENRVFKPGIIDHVDEYHLMIFNRWGEKIFESNDQDIGWDGYVNGKMAKSDVYVWKVEGKYSNGQTFVKTGDVTLMH